MEINSLDLVARYSRDFVVIYSVLMLFTWACNVFAVLLDLWSGLEKAKAKGEKIQSGGLRRTVTKIGDYWKVQAFALMVDAIGSLFYSFPFASMLVGLGILMIEARSVIENLREKRAAAAELPDVIARIIAASNKKEALRIINSLSREKKNKLS